MTCAFQPNRGQIPLLLGLLALGLTLSGCLVQGQCYSDHDCEGGEVCNQLTGACYTECRVDDDCLVAGSYVGKHCQRGRCAFRFDERVAAPDFCLPVANPKSAYHGPSLCLSQLKGQVVLIFFGLMA